jgi:hypothetical protein
VATVGGVQGPIWTSPGLDSGAGRYPLQIERAVSRLVGTLLPGVITTTRHARMYTLHALAWAEAEERGLDDDQAAELVRRCEVVMTAIYANHARHRVRLASGAHGGGRLDRFVAEGSLDVAAAAAPQTGLSEEGFRGVYVGPAAQVGLLTGGTRPRRGERADLEALRAGLGGLIELARQDRISLAELVDAGDGLCLCALAGSPDGIHLRHVLFESVGADRNDDRNRQLTAHMLLEVVAAAEVADTQQAFRRHWGFGAPIGDTGDDTVAKVMRSWRAAILRNYSVGAWRSLWHWLTECLHEEPLTIEQLAERFATTLGDLSMKSVEEELSTRTEEGRLEPVEAALVNEPWTPAVALRQLVLGALRLDDLDEGTRKLFVGSVPGDLGPIWVHGRLEEWVEDDAADLAAELAEMLVHRAQRVALSRMDLVGGVPRIRSRLRDRDGLLSVHGEEGHGEVALRIDALTEILIAFAAVERREDGLVVLGPAGEELIGLTA